MYEPDLKHALRLADVADEVTMRYYRSNNLATQQKPDMTPVTAADTEVERKLSEIVQTDFKESYLGEEGTREGTSGRLWVVDPIDGTKNFIRTMPFWGTLIALTENGVAVATVVSAPALGRRWWATKDGGAYTQETDGSTRKLQVSAVTKLEDAFLLTATLSSWDEVATGQETVKKLINSVWRHRAPGDFINYMFVAEGAADVCIEANPKQWDIEAPGLIVHEAGGKLWTDATPETDASMPRISVASNGLLEGSVRAALNLQ